VAPVESSMRVLFYLKDELLN